MFKFVAIIVTIVFAAILSTASSSEDLNDDSAKVAIERIPYHASIRFRGHHFCSGTVISKDWVLSAGQCAYPKPKALSIRVGSSYSDEGGSIHNVSEIISHENYAVDSYSLANNDIALFRVSPPFKVDATCRPIEIYNSGEETPAGKHAVLSGYGHVRKSSQTRNVLLIQNVTLISSDNCKQTYTTLAAKDSSQICAVYDADNMDVCHNDNGGPLTVDGRLAGVVSRGAGCPGPHRPLVYTNVAYFRNWINQHCGV